MYLGLFALALGLGILAYSLWRHRSNMKEIYSKVSDVVGYEISAEELYFELSKRQGTSFNALLVSSWLFLSVAAGYFFFLTPYFFEDYNYFEIAELASSTFGFLYLGFSLICIAFISILAINLPKIYSYYDISKSQKKLIMGTWIILLAPFLIALYNGTSYPQAAHWIFVLSAYFALVLSEVILISPIIRGYGGMIK